MILYAIYINPYGEGGGAGPPSREPVGPGPLPRTFLCLHCIVLEYGTVPVVYPGRLGTVVEGRLKVPGLRAGGWVPVRLVVEITG